MQSPIMKFLHKCILLLHLYPANDDVLYHIYVMQHFKLVLTLTPVPYSGQGPIIENFVKFGFRQIWM